MTACILCHCFCYNGGCSKLLLLLLVAAFSVHLLPAVLHVLFSV
jgi:hypothetical protein